MRDRALRTVAVEHFQPETARRKIARNRGERVGRRLREQAAWTLVAVDPLADEIVRAELAHVDCKPLDRGGGIYEARRRLRVRRMSDEHQRRLDDACM